MFDSALSTNSLTVYGHVGFDVSTIAGKVTRTVGGSAYYAAMAAAVQGAEVNLVSILGSDFPVAALKHRRLDVSACSQGVEPSAVFSQTYDDRGEVIAFEGKLNVCANLNPELITRGTDSHGAILLTTAPPRQQAQALEWLQAKEFTGLIAIDTTLAYVTEFDALLRRNGLGIGLLFINAAEYETLSQRPPPCTRTVVKCGSQGASLLENGVWSYVPAPAVEQVHTITGAGDVLAGAFLAAYLSGGAPIEALACAVAFATNYVGVGAGCLHQTSGGASV